MHITQQTIVLFDAGLEEASVSDSVHLLASPNSHRLKRHNSNNKQHSPSIPLPKKKSRRPIQRFL